MLAAVTTEKDRAELKIARLEREQARKGLEGKVQEWKGRAEKVEEQKKSAAMESRTQIIKLRAKTKKDKADKHGFVQELQRKMEIGGIQMYCIEKGNEGK